MSKITEIINASPRFANGYDLHKINDLSQYYWELLGEPGKYIEIAAELKRLNDNGLPTIPYLIRLIEAYPEAPDVLSEIKNAYLKENNTIAAFKYSCEMARIYHSVGSIKQNNKLLKIFTSGEIATEKSELIRHGAELYGWFDDYIENMDREEGKHDKQ